MVDAQIREIINNSIDEFLNSTIEVTDRDTILNDDDFNKLMKSPDISSRLSNNDLAFDDGVTVGLSIGYRIGMVNTATKIWQSLPKPDMNETVDPPIDISDDTIEINPDEISYS